MLTNEEMSELGFTVVQPGRNYSPVANLPMSSTPADAGGGDQGLRSSWGLTGWAREPGEAGAERMESHPSSGHTLCFAARGECF